MVASKHTWTPDDDDALREMFSDGCDDHEIASELNLTTGQVYFRRKKLRLKGKGGSRPDVDRRTEALRVFAASGSVTEAARALGTNKASASKMAQRMERDGLLKRLGMIGRCVRYVPTCKDEDRQRTVDVREGLFA